MRATTILLGALVAATLAAPAHAIFVGGFDHLKCYAAKDHATKTTYTADLSSLSTALPNETGCRIRVPAKLVCNAVTPTFDPALAVLHPGGPLGELLVCYQLTCPKQTITLTATDEFGSRSVTVSAPKLVCTPANTALD